MSLFGPDLSRTRRLRRDAWVLPCTDWRGHHFQETSKGGRVFCSRCGTGRPIEGGGDDMRPCLAWYGHDFVPSSRMQAIYCRGCGQSREV